MWSAISAFDPGPYFSWAAPFVFAAIVWSTTLLANDRQRAVEEKVAIIRTLIAGNVADFAERFEDEPQIVVDRTISDASAQATGLERPSAVGFASRGTHELKRQLTRLVSVSFVGTVSFQLCISFLTFTALVFVLRAGLAVEDPALGTALLLASDTFARGLLLDTFEVFRVPSPVEVAYRWSALNVLVLTGRTLPAAFIFAVAFRIFRASSHVRTLEADAAEQIRAISLREGLWVPIPPKEGDMGPTVE